MDNENLQSQIDELKARLDARDKQQITYPLDYQSIKILSKYFMYLTKKVLTIGGVASKTFISYIGKQDSDSIDLGPAEFVVSENTYVQYTVNTSTNIISIIPSTRFRFVDDEAVYFVTEDAFPDPLDGVTTYYVISAASDGLSFKVSDSLGGAEINITTTGTGKQYVFYF